jgi:hypothetical protein
MALAMIGGEGVDVGRCGSCDPYFQTWARAGKRGYGGSSRPRKRPQAGVNLTPTTDPRVDAR